MSKKVKEPPRSRVAKVVARYRGQRWALIPLMQNLQEEFGYVPPSAVGLIAEALDLFPVQVQGVISFYTQFHTTPRGRNVVRVCRGTACHVRGGKTILKLVKQELGIEEGETSENLEYSLETVACIGVCALAPNIVINRDTYGHLNPKKLSHIFSSRGKAP